MSNALVTISERIPNAKHRLFINELFKNNHNATKAYEIVYDSRGDGARASASTLLTNPNIKNEISLRFQENAMEADEVLSRLGDFARGKGVEIKPNDSIKALQLIGKNEGLFGDSLTIKVEQEMGRVLDHLQERMRPESYQDLIEALASD